MRMSARSPGTKRRQDSALARSWQEQSWPLRILRAFLGITFLYAGIQKLADPGFLHSGTPDYIGAQLQAFAQGSPIRPLLLLAGHAPVLVGVVIALLESTIGLGTLLGIAAVADAATGLALSAVLFLSASWHVRPSFLGSDSIYAVAWGAYLAGLLEARKDVARSARAARSRGTRRQRREAVQGLGRREFIRVGLVGLGAVALGGVAFGVEGHEAVTADPPPVTHPSSAPTALPASPPT